MRRDLATLSGMLFALNAASLFLVPLQAIDPWPIVLTAGILAAALPSFMFLIAIRRIGGTRPGILAPLFAGRCSPLD